MKLKIAIQKQARGGLTALLKKCRIGFRMVRASPGRSRRFSVELFFRDDDIPDYVADGVADLGIVGENIRRGPKPVDVVRSSALAAAVVDRRPKAFEYSDAADSAATASHQLPADLE